VASYGALIDAAHRLIAVKGAALPLQRTTGVSYDPVTQARVTVTASYTFRAVGLPPGKSAEFRIGSLERRDLIELHIAQRSQTIRPEPGDIVTWGGKQWTIFWSTTYDPAADGAIYTLAYAE
jgi:hypothetical protein